VKYQVAAAAGAKALVVYNDGADPTRVDPIIMAADGTTIPLRQTPSKDVTFVGCFYWSSMGGHARTERRSV